MRWSSFAVGLGLMLAPLVLGYASVGPVLHDVAIGLLVCAASVVALEWRPARFGLAVPAAWLIAISRERTDANTAIPPLVAGVILLALAAIPRWRPSSLQRLPGPGAHA